MARALRTIQEQAGAVLRPFFDVDLPAHYGDVAAEWNAVRHGCGVIDAGWRGLLRAVGSDRADFLQGMLTNQIKTLAPGQGAHAAHLTVQGRVIADMNVLILDDEIWLDVPVQRKALLRETLQHYLVADDVELVDDAIVPLLSLEGPRSAEVAATVFGAPLEDIAPLAHVERSFEGTAFRVVNANNTGGRGVMIFGTADAAAGLWESCLRAGAVAVGMEALEILRVEAGIPWCDRDMDESTLAPEVGLEDAISFTKGCYIGQEVVERVAARGQVQRKLTGVECDGDGVPSPGTQLMRDGEEVGVITSAVRSFAGDGIRALAYVRRSAWEPETRLELAGGAVARVVGLPF